MIGFLSGVRADRVCFQLLSVFWAEKQSLSKLIRLAASSFDELQHPDDIAALDMASLLSSSVKDLDNLARFHDIKIGPAYGDKNYTRMIPA